jgi:hypothetical protein
MIDCIKLAEAFELLEKTNHGYIELSIWNNGDYEIQLTWMTENQREKLLYADNIDELLEKLKELTKLKPKFKVGDEVYINKDNIIHSFVIDKIHYCDYDKTYRCEGYKPHDIRVRYRWDEQSIFATKNELIDAEINYWENQRDD